MDIVTFGDALLRTGDLDPVYVAVHKAGLDRPTLHRLVLAYWCFYHLGHAAHLAEIKQPKKFWEAMMTSAVNAGEPKPWPRGAERRHFRGAQAVDAMKELVAKYKTADDAVAGMLGSTERPTYSSVSAAAQSHRGFGQWIAFKIADMSERVLGYPTDFNDCHLGIYKDPRQGAAVYFQEQMRGRQIDGALWDYPILDTELEEAVHHAVNLWRKKRAKAPPTGDRLVNVQEIETIFCKYKSHLKGHYPVGKDTLEIGHGLEGWGDLAQQLKRGLPAAQMQLKGV